jgi:hypothetical protein
MSEVQKRYIDAGSCDRGVAANQKAIARWRRFQTVGSVLFALGVVLVAFAVNEYSHLDLTGMTTIGFIGVIAAAAGVIPYSIGKYTLEHWRYEDLNYRLALHFMREMGMGIRKSEEILSKNPRFLDAFEEVQAAVTVKQAFYAGVSVEEQPVTRVAYRIASLMLRDEKTLALKPLLLSLIDGGADLDYDSLDSTLNREKVFR